MSHFTGPDATSKATTMPSHLRGNYFVSSYTATETLSASTTIVMCALPAGSRVTDATLTIDNANLFDTATAGSLKAVQLWHAGIAQVHAGKAVQYITSAQASTQVTGWTPSDVALGYRTSSSMNVVLKFGGLAPVGSGTTTTIFTLGLAYDTSLDGD